MPAVLKAIESKLDTTQMTVNGKTLGENLKDVPLVENDLIYPLSHPRARKAAWPSCMATWLPKVLW